MAWVKQDGGGPEYTNRSGFRALGYTTLAGIAQNPGQLPMIRAMAGHPDVVQGVLSEDQASAALANIAASNRVGGMPSSGIIASPVFIRGRVVKHAPSGKRVTIIRASIGRRDGENLHEVVDQRSGKKFTARESNLKPTS
jgi:hypothetical protein